MKNSYTQNLILTVIEASDSNNWENAVLEWDIIDCEEDSSLSEACICGKERLKYLYTIRNRRNGNILYPIGSSCINKFNREDMNYETSIREKLFKLLHAVEDREYISLTPKLFSRNLLAYFYERGAFQPNRYNHFDPYEDYDFLLSMYNKRNKNEITDRQHSKIRGLIAYSIIPYLKTELNGKIR